MANFFSALSTFLFGSPKVGRPAGPTSQVSGGGVHHTGGWVVGAERNPKLVGVSRHTLYQEGISNTDAVATPLRALYSPYHELQVIRDGVGAAHASYAGRNVCTDFDLTLLVSSGEGLVHLDMLPFRYGPAEGGTFLALLTPDPSPVVGSHCSM